MIRYSKEMKTRRLYSISFNREHNIDDIIKYLTEAKEKGANIIEYDGSSYASINFSKKEEETDDEYNSRIKREEEFQRMVEEENEKREREYYKKLKMKYENENN